jgi:formylglycine-generating enzyme required for sulfatase activity
MARIFISYRRQDARYQARSIHAAFAREAGADNVFMDVDSIPPGSNFRKILKDWVDGCEALLALIGPEWIDVRDPATGLRRLENASDFVRIEIGEALKRDIPVVPVLLDGAPMPRVDQLPEDLQELCDRQAVLVEYRTFDADVERLIRKLRLGAAPAPVPQPVPAPPANDGRIAIDAAIVTGAANGRMLPGNGKTEWFKDHALGPEMVVIPEGQFVMGSPAGEEGREDSEGPQHTVSIKAPFALGRCAVTLAEFGAFVEATGRAMPDELHTFEDGKWETRKGRSFRNPGFAQTPRHPAVGVNWDDATAYCEWLSAQTGKAYRLPSEAEWEYACRAGSSTPFWWGASISTHEANYDGNYTYNGGNKWQYPSGTLPVDTFKPNLWGLYQVHGNVWELCADSWHNNYRGAPEDGSAWMGGDEARRVSRGGSRGYGPRWLRAAARSWYSSGYRNRNRGFRVARSILTLDNHYGYRTAATGYGYSPQPVP